MPPGRSARESPAFAEAQKSAVFDLGGGGVDERDRIIVEIRDVPEVPSSQDRSLQPSRPWCRGFRGGIAEDLGWVWLAPYAHNSMVPDCSIGRFWAPNRAESYLQEECNSPTCSFPLDNPTACYPGDAAA